MPVDQDHQTQTTSDTHPFEEALDVYQDVKEEITDFVKKNPLASVAIAAGIGFILGRLISGRKN